MTFIAPDPTPGRLRRLLARLRPQSSTLKLNSEWKDVGWIDLDGIQRDMDRELANEETFKRYRYGTWTTPEEPEA